MISNRQVYWVIPVFWVLVVSLSGCISAPPKENFYTLSSGESTQQSSDSVNAVSTTSNDVQIGNASIHIAAVSISEIVDRPQLVIRTAPNRVAILEQQRWAQPLKYDIGRVLAENIQRHFASAKVTAYPNNARSADYIVTINILQFESIPGETAMMNIAWDLRRTYDNKTWSYTADVSEAVNAGTGDYGAVVAAHSRALSTLSNNISDEIAKKIAFEVSQTHTDTSH